MLVCSSRGVVFNKGKTMQVKKRTLYIICPIIVVVLICSYITYSDYERKKAEERDKLELKIFYFPY